MNTKVYWLARLLFPGMVDIAWDELMGYVIRFPNKYGNPAPQIWMSGSRGDMDYLWRWLCDQVAFRIELELQSSVKLLKAA